MTHKTILPEGYYILSTMGVQQYAGSSLLYVIGELYKEDTLIAKGAFGVSNYIVSYVF